MTKHEKTDASLLHAGYGRPPAASQFKPGTSGNPRGRPRGRRTGLPYEAVLGQLVTIREDGLERRVTAAEAFLLHIAKRGLAGHGGAARSALTALATARVARGEGRDGKQPISTLVVKFISPTDAMVGLRAVQMAKMLDPYRPSARIKIEPWLVQAALARLGDRRLTIEEQADVWQATRAPGKVQWPEWWTFPVRY